MNCRKMEATVLVAPKVQDALERFQLAALYTDLPTEGERGNLRTQTETFRSSAIPAYYVVDPATGKVLSQLLGAANEDEFLEFLARGR